MNYFKNLLKIVFVTFSLFLVVYSCKNSEINPKPSIDRNALIGKWYSQSVQVVDYTSYTYKIDSTVESDGNNLGHGIATRRWWWGNGDTFYIEQNPKTWVHVIYLTKDSLCVQYEGITPFIYQYHK